MLTAIYFFICSRKTRADGTPWNYTDSQLLFITGAKINFPSYYSRREKRTVLFKDSSSYPNLTKLTLCPEVIWETSLTTPSKRKFLLLALI